MIFDDKYLVLKLKDVDRFLTPMEKAELAGMIRKMDEEREKLGKETGNRYYVVNVDYPMAREIEGVFEKYGMAKTGASTPDAVFLK